MYSLPQISLFRFRWKSCARPAALHIDHYQRDLQHARETKCFTLQRNARTAARRYTERATVAGTDSRADGGDLILGLESLHAEILVATEFVQDIAGRRYGVAAVENIQSRLLPGCDKSQRGALVAGDVAVGAFRHRRRMHFETRCERLARLAVVVARDKRASVRFEQIGLLRELLHKEFFREFVGAAIHPVDETEHEHVLAAVLLLHAEAHAFERVARHLGDVHRMHHVVLQCAIAERIGHVDVACEPQVLRIETIAVGDDRSTEFQLAEVRL